MHIQGVNGLSLFRPSAGKGICEAFNLTGMYGVNWRPPDHFVVLTGPMRQNLIQLLGIDSVSVTS